MSDKAHLLIVEDDPDLSEMLEAFFRANDYDVSTAAWGRDALAISRQQPLSLVMLDIRLPDINGYEVCRQLRGQRRTQDVPILFLTEKRDRVDKLQGLELGVVDYITKPFDIQELRLRVRNAIHRARHAARYNPVTDLPEVCVLDERLNQLVLSDEAWALLRLSIHGLDTLRDRNGFVAADEMMRAVAWMVKSIVREYGGDADVMCHLSPDTLVVVTTVDQISAIRSRIETRVRLSLAHLTSPHDGEDGDRLALDTRVVDHTSGAFADADALKARLLVGENPAA
jgi:DNA-binding response OmpR family regulator